MIGMAISFLWLLIGVIILGLVIYLVLYGLKSIAGIPIPARVEQGVWFVFFILVVIYALYAIEGGGAMTLRLR